MGPHGIVHYENGGLDVHDIVFFGLEEEPIVEKCEFCVARSDGRGASRQEPTDHRPPWDYVRTQ